MKTFELIPVNGRKSFGNKATVREESGKRMTTQRMMFRYWPTIQRQRAHTLTHSWTFTVSTK